MKIFRRVISVIIFLLIVFQLAGKASAYSHYIFAVVIFVLGGIGWMARPNFPKQFFVGAAAAAVIPALLVPLLSNLSQTNEFLYAFLMLGMFVLTCKLVFGRR